MDHEQPTTSPPHDRPSPEAGTGLWASVRLLGICKRFGETAVLEGVDLTVVPGRVHGLVGANGAGKTTLMRILAGEVRADAGQVAVGPRTWDVTRWSQLRAQEAGVAMVHQEVPVFDNLRVYEHFALARYAGNSPWSWRSQARERAQRVLGQVFPEGGLDPDAMVSQLSLAQRQMLEIALAVADPRLRLLVLDEPTSALARDQVEALQRTIRRLQDQGVGVLLVTHRLEEVLALCQHITVLRDGRVAQEGPASQFDTRSLVVAMGGSADGPPGPPSSSRATQQEVVLRVPVPQGAPPDALPVVVRQGEVVGLSGLSGSGQSQLLHRVLRAGAAGVELAPGTRVALVSGDRRGEGLFAQWSTLRNLTIGSLAFLRRGILVSPSQERSLFHRWQDRLGIRAEDPQGLVTRLSGGNQQKVLIARALAADPDVLVLDDPTRGVDAATKADLYRLLRETAAQGKAVLWYSTDDQEMLHCHRVYVLREGFARQELVGSQIRREAIVSSSFGPSQDAALTAPSKRGQPTLSPAQGRWASMAALAGQGWFLAAMVLAALVAAVASLNAQALSPTGLPLLVSSFLPLVLAAGAETAVIAVSDIDIGLGAFMGLVNALSATWLTQRPVWGALAIVAAGLLYTAQALVVELRQVPAIIVTLGASFVWLGLALLILPTPGGVSPAWLSAMGNWNPPLVPEPLLVSGALAAFLTLLFYRTPLGVRLRALGNSPEALTLREGERTVLATRVAAYALAALLAILAGLSMTALTSSADATASQPDTLLGIAAVIIGGGSFVGGRIDPVGAVLGGLLFGLLEALLGLTSINVNYTSLLEGTALIAILAARLVWRPKGVRS